MMYRRSRWWRRVSFNGGVVVYLLVAILLGAQITNLEINWLYRMLLMFVAIAMIMGLVVYVIGRATNSRKNRSGVDRRS